MRSGHGHGGEGGAAAARFLAGDTTTAHGDDAVGQRDRQLRLVRREQDAGAVGHGLADHAAEHVAGGGVEPGVRLVEQPERGAARDQRGQRDPAALARREAAGRRRAHTPGQPEALEGLVRPRRGQAQGADGEPDVLRRAEVVVERGGMSQKTDVAAHGGVVRGQVDTEDGRLTRGDRQQAGAGAQQAGLAGAVGADHDDDLALVEGQIDTGEGGKAAGERDRGTEVNDRGHGLPHHGRGGRSPGFQAGPRSDQSTDQTQA